MEIYEELRDKSASLEDQLDSVTQKLRERDRRIASLQLELDNKNQEMLMKSQQNNSNANYPHNIDHSLQQSDELVSRLSAKVTQLQQNEDILLQELGKHRNLKGSSVVNQSLTESYSQQMHDKFEGIVFEQGEKLIKLEEENATLRRQVRELDQSNRNQGESTSLRMKNLQEINRKYEVLSLQKD